jgi:dUTP pyrophosphatase
MEQRAIPIYTITEEPTVYALQDQSIIIGVKKVHPEVKIPDKKHKGDAGYDLTIVEDIEISAMQSVTTTTGLSFQIPQGYYGQICPRSSMAKAGLTIDGGVIDQSYTGECFVILVNRNPAGSMKLKKGSRVCQILFLPIPTTDL